MHKIKKLLSRLFYHLPYFVQSRFIRSTITLPIEIDDQLVFKIADTLEEVEGSFRLVYEAYLEAGYCDENPYKLRATQYHALDSTSIMIAKNINTNEVVGTLTLVRDNYLGLPIENYVELGEYRKSRSRLAEVTSLVVSKKYRRQMGGHILFPLMKLMYEYATRYFGVSSLVVTVHPKTSLFYKSLLLFVNVPNSHIENYMGAPSETLILNLEEARIRYKQLYGYKNLKRNLYYFFVNSSFPQIQYPDRDYYRISDSVVTKSYYEEVLRDKLGIQLPNKDEVILSRLPSDKLKSLRVFNRFETELRGVLMSGDQQIIVNIKEVSRDGIKIVCKNQFNKNLNLRLKIKINKNESSNLEIQTVWTSSDHLAGFRVIKKDECWTSYVSYLEECKANKVA